MNRPALRVAALFALLLTSGLTTGCHRVAYQSRLPAGGEVHQRQLGYWFWGLRGHHDVDLDALCPQGVAAFRTEATALGLWDFLTLGIYTPRTLIVECTAAGGAR